MKSRCFVLGGLGLAAVFSGACGGSSRPEVVAATLHRAASCGDLLQSLKTDAHRKMNAEIDGSIASLRYSYSMRGGGVVFGAGGEAASGGASDANAGAAPPKDSATSYSQTNTQVKGVDEADFVKNDGTYIYLLHGKTFQVVQAWPAAAMAATSSIDVEGWPTEMFVDQGRVVIYSVVDGTAVMNAAGVAPRTSYSEGRYYFGAPMCMGYGCGYWNSNPLTKVTVLALDNGTTPRVTRETYFEGSYLSSRRVGAKVRTVLVGGAHGPSLRYYPDFSGRYTGTGPYVQPSIDEQIGAYEALRTQNNAAIDASKVADWLPYSFARTSSGVTGTLAKCEDYLVPTEGSTQYGLTQLASMDLDAPNAAPQVTSIVGAVDTIYANEETMVLASRAWMPWSWYWDQGVADGLSVAQTHLHAFDIASDPILPKYEGSATLPGTVHDQFSIDVQKNVLRVATTEQRAKTVTSPGSLFGGSSWSRTLENVNRVFTAEIGGGRIHPAGDAGDLAKGERIQSVRFVGDRGYVVTFRQVDPLFVLDLSNPSAPKVVGEATMPGFSTYMHPLDAGHLLTIGRDADANGRVNGLAVQIFDVTNPKVPLLAHKFVFPTSGAWNSSEALQEHKAFTYFPEKHLLAFPYYSYDWNTNTGTMTSSAELFRIDVQTGILHIGGVEHTGLFGTYYRGWCGGFFTPQVRRAVFMDDVMYSVSYGGVVATDTRTMQPLQTLPLPRPFVDGYSACYAD